MILQIYFPLRFRAINILAKSWFDRLQPSPKYQTITIIYVLQKINEHKLKYIIYGCNSLNIQTNM